MLIFAQRMDILIYTLPSLVRKNPSMSFHGKTAIVTGGTGALGIAIVQRLFDEGAGIAVPYHSEASRSAIPDTLSTATSRLFFAKVDLTKETEVTSFVEEVVGKFGRIDFLVAVAGGYTGGNLTEEVTLDELESMLNMNLRTSFLMCRGVLRLMKQQKGGRIITVASMPAISPLARKGPYAIAKRGVITLTETIAAEVKGTGITANAVAPSIILTEANKESMPDADVSKWVTPHEIAGLVAYLCSDDARSVNGNTIRIYGGL
jgi:NAD(P)-dependent dehydrogenase (short-subunit alcohol dehydrogenase family)